MEGHLLKSQSGKKEMSHTLSSSLVINSQTTTHGARVNVTRNQGKIRGGTERTLTDLCPVYSRPRRLRIHFVVTMTSSPL